MDKNIIDLISTLLDSGKYKEAKSTPVESQFIDSFKNNCWDLISVILSKVQDDTIIVKPSLYGACEELLHHIIKVSMPEEALLEFIEKLEEAKNDAQFGLLLGPLQQLLIKLSVKRGNSLEWCLNSILTYIETIPISEYQLEGKERLLMDSDDSIRRITKVYSLLPEFYEPFIKELEKTESNLRTKQIFAAFFISLLGKPLILFDLDPEINGTSEARQCYHKILQDLCATEKNIFKLLELLIICNNENNKKKNDSNNHEEIAPYDQRAKINLTTLSGLAYAVFSEHFTMQCNAIPQVYSIEFLVNTLLIAVIHLLNSPEYGPLTKGIALCSSVINRLPNNVESELLTSTVHFELCKSLTNISIYSQYEKIRKSAVKLLELHINKFCYKGKYMLIKYLLNIANHSGMIGYVITLYKNTIDQSFKDPVLNEYCKGSHLMSIINKICHLPHGAESDLVELADQIITTLNFLRYLALKDSNNKTGIRDCFSMIENSYLEMLRTCLNLSKAHYELKLKDLEEGKNILEHNVNMSVNVAGLQLDSIPKRNQKEIIISALNAFHLIEGLTGRLSECINVNKLQNHDNSV